MNNADLLEIASANDWNTETYDDGTVLLFTNQTGMAIAFAAELSAEGLAESIWGELGMSLDAYMDEEVFMCYTPSGRLDNAQMEADYAARQEVLETLLAAIENAA